MIKINEQQRKDESPVYFPTTPQNTEYTKGSSLSNRNATVHLPFYKQKIKEEPLDEDEQKSLTYPHPDVLASNEGTTASEKKEGMSNFNTQQNITTISSTINKEQPDISDETLADIPIKELNNLVRGCGNDSVQALRKRRRLLKNRTYAQQFRNKRVQTVQQYTAEILNLKEQLQQRI